MILLEEKIITFVVLALLSAKFVLTAAHCVEGTKANKIQVIVGAHNLDDLASTGTAYDVKRIISHFAYNSQTAENDTALI